MMLSGKYFHTTGGISSQHELCFGDILLIICFTSSGEVGKKKMEEGLADARYS